MRGHTVGVAGLVQVASLVKRAEADQGSNSVLPLTSHLAQCAVMVIVMLSATSYYEIQLQTVLLAGGSLWALRDGEAHWEHTAPRQTCKHGKAWSMGRKQPICQESERCGRGEMGGEEFGWDQGREEPEMRIPYRRGLWAEHFVTDVLNLSFPSCCRDHLPE